MRQERPYWQEEQLSWLSKVFVSPLPSSPRPPSCSFILQSCTIQVVCSSVLSFCLSVHRRINAHSPAHPSTYLFSSKLPVSAHTLFRPPFLLSTRLSSRPLLHSSPDAPVQPSSSPSLGPVTAEWTAALHTLYLITSMSYLFSLVSSSTAYLWP